MSQNSTQSAPSEAEQYAAALAAKFNAALAAVDPEEALGVEPEQADADAQFPEADAAPSKPKSPLKTPERSRRTPRASRTEARERLKFRLECIPGFNRHSRKCQICNHPEIEDLEDEYVNWTSARQIKKTFKLRDESTIYRHARIAGLDVRRRENLGAALGKIVQEVDHLQVPTVTEVIRAIRTLARLNARGKWVFAPSLANSNRQTPSELETGLTHTKQTAEVTSNRQ